METEVERNPVVEEKLIRLRAIIDERETLERKRSELYAEKLRIEHDLIVLADALGTNTLGCDTLSMRLTDAITYDVDATCWDTIYKWAVENGHTGVLHRRVSNRILDELVDDGIGLPEGITMNTFRKISLRRK